MRRFPTALILTGILFAGILGAILYKYRADKTAWEEVQRGLVRLHSGFQFESVIALRSHLADADTALKLYRAEWRTYPPGRKERVRNAERSLGYINSALDWQTRSGSKDYDTLDQSSVLALEKYPDVTSNLSRSCAAGQIRIPSAAASAAFAIAGISLLDRSEYPTASDAHATSGNNSPPLDFEKETAECQRQEIARKESEAKKYWAQFRYRLGLKLLPSQPGTCVFDLKVDGRFVDSIELYPGRTREFGMNRNANIFRAECYKDAIPGAAIQATLNGKTFEPKWNAGIALISPN
jgi:hypothetical protein